MDGGFSISLASAPTPPQPGAAGLEASVDSGFQEALIRHQAAPPPMTAPAAPMLAGPGLPAAPLLPEGAAAAVPGLPLPGLPPPGVAALPNLTAPAMPGSALATPAPPDGTPAEAARTTAALSTPLPQVPLPGAATLPGEASPTEAAPDEHTGLPAPHAPRAPAAVMSPMVPAPSPSAAETSPPADGDAAGSLDAELPTSRLDTPEADPLADTDEQRRETADMPVPLRMSGLPTPPPAGGAAAISLATWAEAGTPPPVGAIGANPAGARQPAALPQAAYPPALASAELASPLPAQPSPAVAVAVAADTGQANFGQSNLLQPDALQADAAQADTTRAATANRMPELHGFAEAPEEAAPPAESASDAPLRLPQLARTPEGSLVPIEPKPPEGRHAPPPHTVAPPGGLISWGFDALAPHPIDAPPPAQNTPPAPPAAPVRQIAPMAVALAFTPGVANGFQLTLDPVELGRVEIRVQREGEAHSIRIIAERPETLALLLRDRQELDRSLADAGLLVEAKGIEFSLGQQSGQADRGPQGEARSGAARRASSAGPSDPEPPPTRAPRGLLDLQI